MKILSNKFGRLKEIKKFEKKLNDLKEKYRELSKEWVETEVLAEIVNHKFIFFTSRKIDPKKISPTGVKKLSLSLGELKLTTNTCLMDLYNFKNKFKPKNKYEERLINYFERKIPSLLANCSKAEELAEAISSLLIEHSCHEIIEFIEELDGYLEEIKRFILQIEHYEKYWERAVKKETYFDIKEVVKLPSYNEKLAKYYPQKSRILKTELKIETSTGFNHNLHRIFRGSNLIHAKVGHNLRIIYIYDANKKRLVYKNIIDHEEQDRLISKLSS